MTAARAWVAKARTTGDPGYTTLAEQAVECQLSRSPQDAEARRWRAHILIQFHRFGEAESAARALVALPAPRALDWTLLGDAQMEQGELDAAAESYQRAVDLRPGLEVYDRIGWLRWLWGDVDGALEMAQMAASAGVPTDPEPLAWALTRLGWLNALAGRPAPELDAALALVADYHPALFARGRVRLHAGSPEAADDLAKVGATVEAVRALAEVAPGPDVETVRDQDPRGYATWLAERDAAKAMSILEEELRVRHDATTRMALAWARWKAGGEVAEEARSALATGIVEPRVLLQAAEILRDPALAAKAAAMGPGLLPSEHRRATAVVP
jgi:tetratricopeptide (TPR) repeat protein